MFNYLLLYFALGLPVIVGLFLFGTKGAMVGRVVVSITLWLVWPFIPVYLIREKLALKRLEVRCAWCDEIVTVDLLDKATWEAHARQCPKHPLKKDIDNYRSALEDICQASSFEGACAIAFAALEDEPEWERQS